MQDKALAILRANAVMAVATLGPDGWPQNTMVSYVSDGLLVYFLISRSSRKFANLQRNNRVSIAIGGDFVSTRDIQGLSMAAWAAEVRHEPIRSSLVRRLSDGHGGNFDADALDFTTSALFRARPSLISVVDFAATPTDAAESLPVGPLTVGPGDLCEMHPAATPDWARDPEASGPVYGG